MKITNSSSFLTLAVLLIANVSTLVYLNLNKKAEKAEDVVLAETPYIGEIILFGGSFAPRGWAFCDGQLLPINENQALFSILGTTFGGDGRVTFALPDLRGRVAVGPRNGAGLNPVREGGKFGSNSVYLNITNMPSHNHTATGSINLSDGLATHELGNGRHLSVNTGTSPIFSENTTLSQSTAADLSINIGHNRGNLPFNIEQPSLGVNYIIALQGLYPSRG